ncbi:MAG TPA: hypothetical protein VN702_17505 [Acetobacteraceae bacterium]|nr:hypothetical protein [Acetobacteraceae bacterium]
MTDTIPTVENLFAPEVYAAEASFFSSGSSTITITLTSYRFDNSSAPAHQKRVVIGRVVMPISGAQGLAAGLYSFLKENGLDPVPPPSDLKQVQ